MKHTDSINSPFWKNSLIWIILLSLLGIVAGIIGFVNPDHFICESVEQYSNSAYSTVQLFLLHHSFDNKSINILQEISRWSIFFAVILLSYDVLSTLFQKQLNFLIIKSYHDHIIICGLTDDSLQLATKILKKDNKVKIVFIDNTPDNPLYNSLRDPRAKHNIIGDTYSRTVLKQANIHKAKEVFIFTDKDVQNVENAKIIFDLIDGKSSSDKVLECFVNIRNLQYKRILNDSKLFSKVYPNFNGRLFNMDETGIKYSLLTCFPLLFNKEKIHILIAGLNTRSIVLIENICHFYNPSKDASNIKITVVEADSLAIEQFKISHTSLNKFADIGFLNKNISLISNEQLDSIAPSSICICSQSEREMIEATYLWDINCKKTEIPILIFSNTETPVAEEDLPEDKRGIQLPLEERNIHLVLLNKENNSFVKDFSENIEEIAKLIHKKYLESEPNAPSYNKLSEHFKDSNRNQAIDMYLKLSYWKLITNKKLDELKIQGFSKDKDEKKLLLAQIEHRRWMIEKYINGWSLEKRNDNKKYREDLIDWDLLTDKAKEKDNGAIDLMWKLLKEGILNEQF